MSRARSILVPLMAVYWLLAMNHCRWEVLSFLDFAACAECTACDDHSGPSHHEPESQCQRVESSFYKLEEELRVLAPAPAPPDLPLLSDRQVTFHDVLPSIRSGDERPPPSGARLVLLAGNPPRAPSLPS